MCDSPLMKRREAIFFLNSPSSSPASIYTVPLPHPLLTQPTTHLYFPISHSPTQMEDPTRRRRHKKNHCYHASTATSLSTTTGEPNDEVEDTEQVDTEVWATFNNSFRQVQSVLDRNRLLIQQVNDNHQSRIPDNMAKNVSLIQELNGNISKVAHIYSDLNSEFTTMYQKRSNNDK